jgi:hypothetical protein
MAEDQRDDNRAIAREEAIPMREKRQGLSSLYPIIASNFYLGLFKHTSGLIVSCLNLS